MLEDFLIPFFTIGLAELGDKTQLALFCLSSKTKKHLELLLGALLAFMVADGLAVLLGEYITALVPLSYLKAGSGLLFIGFGIMTLLSKEEEEKSCEIGNPLMSAFTLILFSEMGDKTQLATALFATRFDPLLVFAGVISALAVLSVMAVYAGKIVMKKVSQKTLSLFAGGLFILLGVLSFL